MLNKEGIEHSVLNAKFHEKEAAIVEKAGVHGAVTIATNMAGRGTDIKLDDEARAAGGLRIIGTERHESRRIDNQLRGRAGRQGDPGESQFYISLEDDLMRLFGSERLMGVFEALGVPEGEQIHHKMLSSAIERAQQKIEENNFGIRKNLMEYDEVMNEQRELVYAQRKRVLHGENMRDQIMSMIDVKVSNSVDVAMQNAENGEKWDLKELNQSLRSVIPLPPITAESIADCKDGDELKAKLLEKAEDLYKEREAQAPEPEMFREIERVVLLRVIDRHWMQEIDDMDQLKQGIGLQAYGQHNPVDECEPPLPRPHRAEGNRRREEGRRAAGSGHFHEQGGRPVHVRPQDPASQEDLSQRPLPLRLRQEVQELPRPARCGSPARHVRIE